MGWVGLRVRYERRNAKRWVGVVVLLALAGGAAEVAATGARRTETAYERGLASANASDAVVNANISGTFPAKDSPRLRPWGEELLQRVDSLPMVASHGRRGGSAVFNIVDGHVDQRLNTGSSLVLVPFDDAIGRTLSTLRLRAGRRPDPARADEILMNPAAAAATGWTVGSRIDSMIVVATKDLDESFQPDMKKARPLSLTVTGIAEVPEEILQPASERGARFYATPAYTAKNSDSVYYLQEWVRLRGGSADIPQFRAAVEQINREHEEVQMPFSPTMQGLSKANRSVDPLVNGLWILAGLAALVGLLLAAQSMGRAFIERAGDHAQYRAMGATQRQRFVVEFATLLGVALVASVAAVVVGVFFSPLTPVGNARAAEPHSGFSVNLALSAAVFGVLFVGTVLVALISVVRVSAFTAIPGPVGVDARDRASHVGNLAARAGLSAPAVVGSRLALQPGRGPTATPVRSVLTSLTIVIAVVTATFAFGVNLQRWTSTPRLYGWNWDAAAGGTFGSIPPDAEQLLAHAPDVAEASGLTVGHLTVGPQTIPAIGISPLRGQVAPVIDEGRLPANLDEIVLGEKTMRALHTHIGGAIDAQISGTPARLTVVGRTSFAALGDGRFGEAGLGVGALGVAARFPPNDGSDPPGHFHFVLFRFDRGAVAGGEAKMRALLTENGCGDASCLLTSADPAEIAGYRTVRGLPLAVSVVLVLLLLATLTHVLLSTMRRRLADFAILRALGETPRQLRATMRWQALVLVGTALAIGIPVGLVLGRFAWEALTDQVGVSPGTVWPIAVIVLAAAALLVLAWLLATVTARLVPRRVRTFRTAGQ